MTSASSVSSGVTRLDASVGVDPRAAIAAAEVPKSVVGHDLPSSLLHAGDRITN
jgi:hydroxymethylglutaryl-CoA lyase